MTKSELIEILTQRQGHLKADDVDLAVKALLEMMAGALAQGDRIEIRGTFPISSRARSCANASATPRPSPSKTDRGGPAPPAESFRRPRLS